MSGDDSLYGDILIALAHEYPAYFTAYPEPVLRSYIARYNRDGLMRGDVRTPFAEGTALRRTTRLTEAGQEFLELVRDEPTWQYTRGVISEQGLPLTLETVREIVAGIRRKQPPAT